MINQKGSIFVWIIIAVFVILVGVGAFWIFFKSKPAEVNDTTLEEDVFLTETEVPEASPDYNLVQETYHLDEEQLDILSRVQNDSRL